MHVRRCIITYTETATPYWRNHAQRQDERTWRRSTNKFQNDLFFAMRLMMNDTVDTEMIAGVVVDLDHTTRNVVVEWKRRLSDRWSLKFEAVAVINTDEQDILYATRRDSFVAMNATYNF